MVALEGNGRFQSATKQSGRLEERTPRKLPAHTGYDPRSWNRCADTQSGENKAVRSFMDSRQPDEDVLLEIS